MVHAFVMVKTGAGRSEELVTAVRDIDQVAEAHIVAGDYDLIVEVSADEVYEILHTVSSGIQGMDGVADTRTYISLDE